MARCVTVPTFVIVQDAPEMEGTRGTKFFFCGSSALLAFQLLVVQHQEYDKRMFLTYVCLGQKGGIKSGR